MLRCCLVDAAVLAPRKAGAASNPGLSWSGLSEALGDTGVSGSCRVPQAKTSLHHRSHHHRTQCTYPGVPGLVRQLCYLHYAFAADAAAMLLSR